MFNYFQKYIQILLSALCGKDGTKMDKYNLLLKYQLPAAG